MQIRSVSVQSGSGGSCPLAGNSPLGKAQRDFQNLGNALQSGNLSDAQAAFAQWKTDSPPVKDGDDSLSSKIDSLGKALDSGELDSAREAYSQIQQEAPPSSSGSGPQGGSGSKPAGERPKAGGPGGGSQSSKTYDKKDLNKDGTVSAVEETLYDLQHPVQVQTDSQTSGSSTGTAGGGVGTNLDLEA